MSPAPGMLAYGAIAASRRRSGGGGGGGGTATYRAAVAADSPVLFMPMDEPSGSFVDHSTNAFTGTQNGSLTRAQSSTLTALGNGCQFGGTSSDNVAITHNAALDITGDVTFEAWIKVTTGSVNNNIWSKGTGGYGFWVLSSNKLSVTNTTSGVHGIDSTTALTTNVWYHVAITRSGNSWVVYIDGIQDATATFSLASSATGATANIGTWSSIGFNGLISNFALYNTALSAARIRAHYLAANAYYNAITALSTQPSSYWPCQEHTGNAIDVGSGGKDLTYTGTVIRQVVCSLNGVHKGYRTNTTGYLYRASALTAFGATGFSIGGWLYLDNVAGLTMPWFCASYSGGHIDPYYSFYLSNQGGAGPTYNYRWAIARGGAFDPKDTSTAQPATGSWLHMLFTFDLSSNVATLYINGSALTWSPNTKTGSTMTAMGTFALGTIPALNSTTYTPGARYAHWGFWENTVLTATDASNLYNAGVT